FWVISGLLYLFFASACAGDGKRDIRDYYFPVEELRSGKVYEYDLAEGDSSSPEYWFYRAFQRDSGLYLAGTYYDNHFQIGQIIREKIESGSVVAREYSLYDADVETGKQIQTNAVIESPDVYPFRVKDSVGVLIFSLKYQPATDPSTTIYLTRHRIFLGDAPAFEFKGLTYPCIRFGLLESIGTTKGGDDLLKGRGEEWYAKGLGLVYYRKIFGKNSQVRFEYRLKDVFPMSGLEKKAAAYFGE
ncbi:MAG TPA: hypothetical protein PK228_02345, partial [Saprospiraceae bacterium]|nr:hypothetical protein [Saprospiraceae bacterium]